MSFIIKFFAVLTMTSIMAIDADVIQTRYDSQGAAYQEGNVGSHYSISSVGRSYVYDNIHGSIINGKKSGQYDEAKEKFEKLECKWCKEKKKPCPKSNSQCGNQ